jgi:hypothetical protein
MELRGASMSAQSEKLRHLTKHEFFQDFNRLEM